MANSGVFELIAGTALHAADVFCWVDTTDATQSANGSLKKITVTNVFASIPVPVVVTSASANALAVGLAGSTNPAFLVDSSTALQAAGLKVAGAVAAGTVAVSVVSSGAAANVSLDAKGTGTIAIGVTSTGSVTIGNVVLTHAGAVSGITTLAGTGAVSGFTTYTGSGAILISTNAIYFQGKSSTAVTRDLIGMSAADKVRIDNNGIGVDFGAGATFASGVTVSAGTTAVQALTASVATITNATAGAAISIDPTAGGAGDNSQIIIKRNGAVKWQVGNNVSLGGDVFEIYATVAGGYAIQINPSTKAVTLSAGISCTTGTFSTSAQTANGSTSVPNNTATTLLTLPGAGIYILNAYANDGSAWSGGILCSWDGTNSIGSLGISGTFSWSIPGSTIKVTQTSGVTKTITWQYFRIA